MGKDCNCHDKSDHDHKRKCCKPVLQALVEFNPLSNGQVISNDRNVTVVKFDQTPIQKCIGTQQDLGGGTAFIIRKSGIYNVQFGGVFVLSGEGNINNWDFAAGVVVVFFVAGVVSFFSTGFAAVGGLATGLGAGFEAGCFVVVVFF